MMDVLAMIFNDPVVAYSFAGLGVLFGICGYLAYYVAHKINEIESTEKP